MERTIQKFPLGQLCFLILSLGSSSLPWLIFQTEKSLLAYKRIQRPCYTWETDCQSRQLFLTITPGKQGKSSNKPTFTYVAKEGAVTQPYRTFTLYPNHKRKKHICFVQTFPHKSWGTLNSLWYKMTCPRTLSETLSLSRKNRPTGGEQKL